LVGDYPRCIGLLNHQTIIVLTNEGWLLQYSPITGNWKQLLMDEEYSSYSVLSLSPCGEYAALGNISGGLKLVTLGKSQDILLHLFNVRGECKYLVTF
jgi:hypothetical protein